MAVLQRAAIDTAAGGTVAVVAAATGKTIRVYEVFFTLAVATTVQFKDGTTALTGAMTLAASTVHRFGNLRVDPGHLVDGNRVPEFVCTSGNAFNLVFGAAQQCSGQIIYSVDDA